MGKIISKFFFILIIGALGGIIFQAFILPYLATKEYFKQFGFVRVLTEREVHIYPAPDNIIIQENTALQEAIEKVDRAVIGIRSQSGLGGIVEGTGLVLTNDGHMVTLGSIMPKGYTFSFFWEEEELSQFQILKVGLKENLVNVKLEKADLPTVAFFDGEMRLGQRVFLVGVIFEKGKPKKIVDEGIIQSFNEDSIQTNIAGKSNLQGSPLFDIEGKVIGLAVIDKTGQVSAIPVQKIREFTGF